ncbi:hypothetical protein B0H16DRAFT_1481617 [Mycena metata]|uniref:Uncharacterized protein n=1 Tax=Mycena metata TaxID=1033252 RepID=A0AAD7M9P8_9AGAR|nr:hypothetical protein B0H16DRAFT_1481617 [Mycena metata]
MDLLLGRTSTKETRAKAYGYQSAASIATRPTSNDLIWHASAAFVWRAKKLRRLSKFLDGQYTSIHSLLTTHKYWVDIMALDPCGRVYISTDSTKSDTCKSQHRVQSPSTTAPPPSMPPHARRATPTSCLRLLRPATIEQPKPMFVLRPVHKLQALHTPRPLRRPRPHAFVPRLQSNTCAQSAGDNTRQPPAHTNGRNTLTKLRIPYPFRPFRKEAADKEQATCDLIHGTHIYFKYCSVAEHTNSFNKEVATSVSGRKDLDFGRTERE